jgi:hypothetical protein
MAKVERFVVTFGRRAVFVPQARGRDVPKAIAQEDRT